MFAILETGGKQYKVEAGDIIEVETIDKALISKDNVVNFDQVLLIRDTELVLGDPFIKDGNVEAKILDELKSPKVVIFKKKSKKGFRRTRGHRQHLHRVRIEKIEIKKTVTAEKKEERSLKTGVKTETKTKIEKKASPARKKPEKKTTPKTTVEKDKTTATSSRKTTTAKKKEK